MRKKKKSRHILITLAVVVSVIIGIFIGFIITPKVSGELKIAEITAPQSQINVKSFIPVNGMKEVTINIEQTTLSLLSGCRALVFDVTNDQAFSIALALENTTYTRPLTHDLMKDALENFDINIIAVGIDSVEEGIYKAKIYMQHDNRVLEIDARPSDSIAMALRVGAPIRIKNDILDNFGTGVC